MTFNLKLNEAIDRANALAEEKDAESIIAESTKKGRYTGLPVQFERGLEDRSGKLLRALTYFDALEPIDEIDKKDIWHVPVGAWLDGASIPRPFWSIIGGPYTGKYFPASVVHDHYCIIKTRSWQNTHRMFHTAMRTSGVGKLKAKVMFYACLLYTSPSPRDQSGSRMPSSA